MARKQKQKVTLPAHPEQPLRYDTIEDWQAEAARRFGPDENGWRFVCPACGHVATVAEWKALGALDAAAFSCVGRYQKAPARDAFGGKGTGPCNYAGGGLFQLNPIHVSKSRAFAFAEAL